MNGLCMRLPVAAIVAAVLLALVPCWERVSAQPAQDAVRGSAEDLAEAASKEFGVILERQRLAQVAAPKSDAGAAPKENDAGQERILSWFERSRREFQALMQMLAGGRPQPRDLVAEAEKKPAPAVPAPRTADALQVETPPKADSGPPTATDPKKLTEERRAAQTGRAEPGKAPGGPVKAGEAKPDQGKRAAAANATKRSMEESAKTANPSGWAKRPPETKQLAEAKTKEQGPRPGEGKASGKVKRSAQNQAASDQEKVKAPKPEQAEPTGKSKTKIKTAAADKKGAGAKQAAQGRRRAEKTTSPAVKAPASTRKADGAAADRRRKPAPAACPAAGRTARVPGWYIVRSGDTLSSIARRHYGSVQLYRPIRSANRRRIRDPDRIYPCQRVYLPRIGRRDQRASASSAPGG